MCGECCVLTVPLHSWSASGLNCLGQFHVVLATLGSISENMASSFIFMDMTVKEYKSYTTLMTSCLTYCTVLYIGVSQASISHLRLVQNAAPHRLTGTCKLDASTPYWLPSTGFLYI